MTEDRCPDAVIEAFKLAGIEYGRADHVSVGGREVIYEINTNPDIGQFSRKGEKFATKHWRIQEQSWARICSRSTAGMGRL